MKLLLSELLQHICITKLNKCSQRISIGPSHRHRISSTQLYQDTMWSNSPAHAMKSSFSNLLMKISASVDLYGVVAFTVEFAIISFQTLLNVIDSFADNVLRYSRASVNRGTSSMQDSGIKSFLISNTEPWGFTSLNPLD